MKATGTILWKVFVKTYYRENAGFFFFFFIVLFGVIAPSQQLAYHYALIRGLLDSMIMLGVAFFGWTLYALKCSGWVAARLEKADHGFMQLLPVIGKRKTFLFWLQVQVWLYLPVLLYALCVAGIAVSKGFGGAAVLVAGYCITICLISAGIYYRLLFPGSFLRGRLLFLSARWRRRRRPYYWMFLLRYLLAENKLLLAAVKISGCLALYILLQDQGPADYDIRMPYLLYSMALFGHGILIYRIREMEESRLLFYRSLPVPLFGRWLQYVLLYFLLLLPEYITIGWLWPVHIQCKDAIGCMLSAYSVLLLLNSCLFIALMKRSEFLKLSLGIFGILYFGVLSGGLILLSGLFFIVAGCLFLRGYGKS